MNIILKFFFAVSLLCPSNAFSKNREHLKIVDGVVTINQYQSDVLRLEGDWRFSDKNLTTVDESLFNSLPLKNAYQGNSHWVVYVPGPSRGSFVLKVDVDQSYSLAAFTPGISARSQLLIVNNRGIHEAFVDPDYGKTSLEGTRRELASVIIPLELAPGSNFLIYNYEQQPVYIGGIESVAAGFSGQFELGSHHDIIQEIFAEKVTLLIPTGIFLCLSIYSLLIYISRRRKDSESLLLFCLNLAMFFKEMSSQFTLSQFMQTNWFTQLISSSVMYTPLLTTFFGISVVHLTNKSSLLKYMRLFVFTLIIISIPLNLFLTFGTNIPDLALLNYIFFGVNAANLFFIFIPYMVICALRNKQTELVLLAVGYCALGAGVVFDLYKTIAGVNFPWMAMWGGTFLSVIFAKNNSKMFALTYERSERLNRELQVKNAEVQELNANLEIKVLERTAEVRSLLQHTPQGILTIGAGGVIGSNYSDHLPDIISCHEIGGRNFKELILDHTDLSRDTIDRVWQSLLAILGENALNFEVNVANLPMEFSYGKANGKVLKCTWNAELDDTNTVKRVLVTLLDVTSEIEARKELDEKNKEFNIVRQLLDIGITKCRQFFTSGYQLLEENRRLINCGNIDEEVVKILFVNMHTLKGMARTLQLSEISEQFHIVESYYAEVLRNGVAIDNKKLRDELEEAYRVYRRYENVNRNVLGRTEDDSKVVIDRDFLQHNLQVLNYLDQASILDSNLKEIIRNNCDRLVKLIFMSLPLVLDEIVKQTSRIAKDLMKAEPIITIDMDDIMISHKQEAAVKNAFIHLLRNSLDHGIELPVLRAIIGKDPRGHIKLAAWQRDGQIFIRFEDDGAGLAIGDLREKGRALQLIQAEASLQEIAELIFHQGMSTAKSVSQISGRGVGMDAVRRFIESEAGSVDICLDQCIAPDEERYRFYLLIRLPCQQTNARYHHVA